MALACHGTAAAVSAPSFLPAPGGPIAIVTEGEGPVVTFALHAGHALRPCLEAHCALGDSDRLREEDPHTARMAPEGRPLVEVLRSRFEVDLNRPRFRAVYQGPGDAWGLEVWRGELPDEADRASRAVYDAFYAGAFELLSEVAARHGRFVVLDLHSYNHRREGPHARPADPKSNPGINLGTRRIDRERWTPVVDAFMACVREAGIDVGENIKFGGGHFAHWVAETFGDQGAALAIEFKKTYMDEWTGEVDEQAVARNRALMTEAADAVEAALGFVG